MIYPTRLAILATAAGGPIALLIGLFVPHHWYAGLAWPLAVLLLALIDAVLGPAPRHAHARLIAPAWAYVGRCIDATVEVAIAGARPPDSVAVAISADPLLDNNSVETQWATLAQGKGSAKLSLEAVRRGTATIDGLWLRWSGMLGLVWKQRMLATDTEIAILPDIQLVRERGMQLFERYALQGLMAQLDRGDGTDFNSLVEHHPGMDRRTIDWKQSARHLKLHAKEFHTERNNQVVFAIDAGRQMCEPVANLSRLDRVISAALLTAWIALKSGDRAALHAFDIRPRIAGGFVSGAGAFTELQRLAARIAYSGEETNYTFALTSLAAQLTRRSLIILFTEFTDHIAAEFLVQAAARVAQKHLLLLVVLRDEELESILERRPATSEDVTRSVTAAALLKDRLMVLTRLRHLGIHVIESRYDEVGERLVAGYVDLKRRNLL